MVITINNILCCGDGGGCCCCCCGNGSSSSSSSTPGSSGISFSTVYQTLGAVSGMANSYAKNIKNIRLSYNTTKSNK